MPLTVAIPTIGRPSLARTVFSFIEQLADGDEVIIVADAKGDPDYARFIHDLGTNRLGVNWQFAVHEDERSGWGQAQRNRAYDLAADGNHVWCLADDDVATPGALDAIRYVTASGLLMQNEWFIFRVGRGTDEPWVWNDQSFRVGNFDADCFVAPSGVASRFGLDYTGDFAFARALVAELGEPWWNEDVIAVTKPNSEYLDRHYHRLAGLRRPNYKPQSWEEANSGHEDWIA